MQIEMRPIDSIHPFDNNPRVNDPAVDAVARSIQEFGFRQPIVVDEQGIIIVGHTRYKAAIKLGGLNSWRGDEYESELRRLIDDRPVTGGRQS